MAADDARARLFTHGGSQAVRLPKAFRMPGTEVRVRRLGARVVLEPLAPARVPWEEIDAMGDSPFMPAGREQPPMPADRRRKIGP